MKTSSLSSPSFSTIQPRGQVGKLLFRPEGWSPPLPRCDYCATAAIPGLCPAVRRPATDELERDDATEGATRTAGNKKRRTAFKPPADNDCFVPIDKPLIEIVVETERRPREADKTGDVEMKDVGTKERALLRSESGDVEMFFPGELCW